MNSAIVVSISCLGSGTDVFLSPFRGKCCRSGYQASSWNMSSTKRRNCWAVTWPSRAGSGQTPSSATRQGFSTREGLLLVWLRRSRGDAAAAGDAL